MTPEETAALLMWIAGHDRRHEVGTLEEAEIRRRVWAKMMAEVPFEFARLAVDRHYAKVDAPEVKPAHVQMAWRTQQRRAESTDRSEVLPGFTSLGRRPVWYDQMKAECDAVRAAGGDVEMVQVPGSVTRVDDTRERRCVNHETCLCTHDTCRDGWLDEQTVITNGQGRRYAAARRCPVCFDVVLMQGENTSSRGRRRR